MAKRKPRYAVELKSSAVKAKHPTASFMAGNERVVLSAEKPRYVTTDELVYYDIRELPFLNALGEVEGDEKEGGD